MTYDTRAQIPPIMFMGLNTHVSELFIRDYSSPDMNNVDLHPVGAIKKRAGVDILKSGVALDERSLIYSDDPYDQTCHFIDHLPRESEQDDFLYVFKSGFFSMRDMHGTDGWNHLNLLFLESEKFGMAVGPYTDENHTAAAGDDTYMGECGYIVAENGPPMIVDGATWGTDTGVGIDAVNGGAATTKVTIDHTAHGFHDGDLVVFSNFSPPDPWEDPLSAQCWMVCVITADQYALCDGDLNVLHVASGETWPTDSSPTFEVQAVNGNFRPWPLGVYDAVNGERGYLKRWLDPNETADYAHYPYSIDNGLPHKITIMGSALSLRAYAYGFAHDPDRIDVSELGAPSNFLKNDVLAADEASATNQPGVDGTYFYCRRGDGDRVVRVVEFRGLKVVFKQRTTTIYTGEPGYDLRRIQTINVGAVSYRSVVETANDIFFWSQDGPRRLSTTEQFGDLLSGSISENIMEIVAGVTGTAQEKIIGYHDRLNKRIVWHHPAYGAAENDACLVFYYPDQQDPQGRWTKYTGLVAQMGDAISIRSSRLRADTMYGVSTSGDGYQLHVGVLDDYINTGTVGDPVWEPVPIESYYVTRWFDFGQADLVKRALDGFIVYTGEGAGEVRVYHGRDYLSSWDLITDIIGASGESPGYWDYMLWNYPDLDLVADPTGQTVGSTPANPDWFYWDTTGRAFVEMRLKGLNHIMRFKIEDSSLLSFGIGGIIVDARIKGKRS